MQDPVLNKMIIELRTIEDSVQFNLWIKELGGQSIKLKKFQLINGYYEDLAVYLHYKYGVVIYKIDNRMFKGGHYFIKHVGLYFDATSPEGVKNPSELLWSRKFLETSTLTPYEFDSYSEKNTDKLWTGYIDASHIFNM